MPHSRVEMSRPAIVMLPDCVHLSMQQAYTCTFSTPLALRPCSVTQLALRQLHSPAASALAAVAFDANRWRSLLTLQLFITPSPFTLSRHCSAAFACDATSKF